MEIESQIVLSLFAYKLGSLAVGLCTVYLGYRLFVLGIWGDAGDMEAKFQDNKLIVKAAAPGTFFVVLGAVVVCFTIYKGLELKNHLNTYIPSSERPVNSEEQKNVLPEKSPLSK